MFIETDLEEIKTIHNSKILFQSKLAKVSDLRYGENPHQQPRFTKRRSAAELPATNSFTARRCRLIIMLMRKRLGLFASLTSLPARLSNTNPSASARAKPMKLLIAALWQPTDFRLSADSSRLTIGYAQVADQVNEIFTEV